MRPREPGRRLTWAAQARILAAVTFGALAVYALVTRYVALVGEVVGDSMTPTLQSGDRYLVNRLAYRGHEPRRGDIVALRMPRERALVVKRIVALPGERVAIRDGGMWIDGAPLVEPYLPPGTRTAPGRLKPASYEVAPGCYFVLGDDRAKSFDSRQQGAVPRTWIVGRVLGAGP